MHVGIQLKQAETLSLASMVQAVYDNPSVAAFLENKGSVPAVEEGLKTPGLELS